MRLCAFDLRRVWPLAAAVPVLEVWRASVIESALHQRPTEWGAATAFDLAGWIDAALWLLLVVTTAVVVQADHPTDDRAFWRTRPIPPLVLGVAKAGTLALLFIALPAAVNAVRLGAYGAPLVAIVIGSLQILARAGLVILPVWALALGARTLPRVLAAAAIVIGTGYAIVLAAFLVDHWWQRIGPPGSFTREETPGIVRLVTDWQRKDRHGWAPAVGLTGAGVIVLVALYPTRRRWLAAVAGAAVVVVPSAWPAVDTDGSAPPALVAAIGQRMTIPAPVRVPARRWLEAATTATWVNGAISLPGLPSNYEATLAWRSLVLTSHGRAAPVDGHSQRTGASPLDVIPRSVAWTPERRPWDPTLFTIAPADALSVLAPPLGLRGDADIRLTEHRVLGTLPVAAGAAIRTDRFLFEIVRVDPSSALIFVRLARFPRAGAPNDRLLSCFVQDDRRTLVLPTLTYWGGDTQPAGTSVWQWSTGRDWVELFQVTIHDGRGSALMASRPKLVLVESRQAGRLRTMLAAPDVAIRVVH